MFGYFAGMTLLSMRSLERPSSQPPQDISLLVDKLRAQREKTRTDRALCGRVLATFESSDAPTVTNLQFYIFEGAISVYGAVPTFADRDAVVTSLGGVAGITQISDHLTVLS